WAAVGPTRRPRGGGGARGRGRAAPGVGGGGAAAGGGPAPPPRGCPPGGPPPSLSPRRTSSPVSWCATPFAWAALPPLLEMARRCSGVSAANPRRDFFLATPSPLRLLPARLMAHNAVRAACSAVPNRSAGDLPSAPSHASIMAALTQSSTPNRAQDCRPGSGSDRAVRMPSMSAGSGRSNMLTRPADRQLGPLARVSVRVVYGGRFGEVGPRSS